MLPIDQAREPAAVTASTQSLHLDEFFPYRLSVAYDEVSRSVGAVYSERFGLGRNEWRVLAVVAAGRELSGREVGALTRLDKMQVSRAAAALASSGYLSARESATDRRRKVFRLTAAGRSLHRKIVPLVRERERALLSALSSAEQRALEEMLTRLATRAREL